MQIANSYFNESKYVAVGHFHFQIFDLTNISSVARLCIITMVPVPGILVLIILIYSACI